MQLETSDEQSSVKGRGRGVPPPRPPPQGRPSVQRRVASQSSHLPEPRVSIQDQLDRIRQTGLRKVQEDEKRYAAHQCIDEPMHQICLSEDFEQERSDKWQNALYLGGIDAVFMHDALGIRNVKLVVSILGAQTPLPPRVSGIEYWRSPPVEDVSDTTAAGLLLEIFDEVHRKIDEVLAQGNSVLLHCHAGRSRSGTVAIGYVMKKLGTGRDAALQRVRKCREIVKPNAAFMDLLGSLEGEAVSNHMTSSILQADHGC